MINPVRLTKYHTITIVIFVTILISIQIYCRDISNYLYYLPALVSFRIFVEGGQIGYNGLLGGATNYPTGSKAYERLGNLAILSIMRNTISMCIRMYAYIHPRYNIGKMDLSDTFPNPRAIGPRAWAYISGKSRLPVF